MTKEEADKLNLEAAKDNGNALAFPTKDAFGFYHYGLTKREYMATQLMSGLLSDGKTFDMGEIAEHAVVAVDLLLIELNKNK